jgi:urease accessory protein
MDGDGQLVELTARAGSRAVVAGQSATRIHPSPNGFCTQQWRVHVERDALLVVLPGPAIPFQGCRYYQRIAIDLEEGAGLVWGDLWLAGRYARGEVSERFRFHTIVQELTVQRASAGLVFRDRFCWRGPWDDDSAQWHFGPHPACGSLFVSGSIAEESLAEVPLETALFPTRAGDTCLRWCGPTEEVIRSLVPVALRAAARLANAGGESWLSGAELAPAHWFTPMAAP